MHYPVRLLHLILGKNDGADDCPQLFFWRRGYEAKVVEGTTLG
jgi:hypothetical protein